MVEIIGVHCFVGAYTDHSIVSAISQKAHYMDKSIQIPSLGYVLYWFHCHMYIPMALQHMLLFAQFHIGPRF